MSKRNDLITLLAPRSAKLGNVTLASGRQSSLYIDARITTMSPEGLALIGPLGLEAIREAGWQADSVGGLTLRGGPNGFAARRRSDRLRDRVRQRCDRCPGARIHRTQGAQDPRRGTADRGAFQAAGLG